MGKDYIYQFEKDESDSNYKYDKIIQYYALGGKLTFWKSNIIEKLTDNYLTVSEVIMNQMAKVRVKLEDITPYEGRVSYRTGNSKTIQSLDMKNPTYIEKLIKNILASLNAKDNPIGPLIEVVLAREFEKYENILEDCKEFIEADITTSIQREKLISKINRILK